MITADVTFVNGNTFMITTARKLKYTTVEHIPIKTANQLSKSLNKAIKLYGRCGFIIHVILLDTEFENVDEILGNFEAKIKAAR